MTVLLADRRPRRRARPTPTSCSRRPRLLLATGDIVIGHLEIPHVASTGLVLTTDVPGAARAAVGARRRRRRRVRPAHPGRQPRVRLRTGGNRRDAYALRRARYRHRRHRPQTSTRRSRRRSSATATWRSPCISINCVGPRESWATTLKPGDAYVEVITHYEARTANPGGPPRIYTFADRPSWRAPPRRSRRGRRTRCDRRRRPAQGTRPRAGRDRRLRARDRPRPDRRRRPRDHRPPCPHPARRRGLPGPSDLPRTRQLRHRDPCARPSPRRRGGARRVGPRTDPAVRVRPRSGDAVLPVPSREPQHRRSPSGGRRRRGRRRGRAAVLDRRRRRGPSPSRAPTEDGQIESYVRRITADAGFDTTFDETATVCRSDWTERRHDR